MDSAAQTPGKVYESLPFSPGSSTSPALLGQQYKLKWGRVVSWLLTLVVDEAVCCQQLERMDLKEHPVEEQVISCWSLVWVEGQARQNELLTVKGKA